MTQTRSLQGIKVNNKISSSTIKRVSMAASAVVIAMQLSACQREQEQTAVPTPTVIVEKAVVEDLQSIEQYTARVEAKEKVEIRARVEGFLEQREFKEGSIVKKGQKLYVIEKDNYQIAVASATAALADAKAKLELANQTYKRIADLAIKKVTSQQELDNATATQSAAKAGVDAAQAALNKANLNLSYTDVISPLDGKIGRSQIAVGNLVTPASPPLVEIVQQEPIYVTFPVPQRRYLEVAELGKKAADAVYVELTLGDGSTYKYKGQIAFSAVEATETTDSITIRALFTNPDSLLIDQQVVYAKVISKASKPKLMAPQAALLADQEGTYVLQIVDKKVKVTRIKVGEERGTKFEVLSGIKEGDEMIVSGHQKVKPGMEVNTKEAPKDEESYPAVVIKK